MYSPLPIAVLYAGLAGMVLALLIATAQNRWSCRVFFFLALRLAIGWHFLFEGLYKLNSELVGPTETNRPFTSEPYFRNAPGPVAAYMRKQFADPLATIDAKVKAPKTIAPTEFAKLSVEQQAAECPEAVAKQIDAGDMEAKTRDVVTAEAERLLKDADDIEQKALAVKGASEDDKAKARADAEAARQAAKKKLAEADTIAKQRVVEAKAEYARWVYGVDGRDTTVKFVNGPVSFTGPERLEHLDFLRKAVKETEERLAAGLGNGYGTEQKRAAEVRTALITAESDLARDADAFVAELKKALNGGTEVKEEKPATRGETMDKVTTWFLIGVGACLLAGLFTRLACLLGAGFLVMTYLTYPPFPWYPLPPNTEGNPLFINKNVIECLALLALACMPTGRWMGLDAIVLRPFRRYRADNPAA